MRLHEKYQKADTEKKHPQCKVEPTLGKRGSKTQGLIFYGNGQLFAIAADLVGIGGVNRPVDQRSGLLEFFVGLAVYSLNPIAQLHACSRPHICQYPYNFDAGGNPKPKP